ncbi:MAG: transposase [PVC group bacterium]|nr:transposase [PVC group bacterium]
MEAKVEKNVFKQIFRDHWEEFQENKPRYQTEYYSKTIKKMLGCGDIANGHIIYRCLSCGEEKKVPFSCKSSFCLTCAKVYTDNWVEYVGEALFEGVRYRHVVLTVPEEYRRYFYNDPRLLDELMRTGHTFYKDLVSDWLKEPIEVGSIVVLQTAGRSGKYNPHLHILETSGGLTSKGKWKGFGYIDYKLLHNKWQYYLLGMLERIGTSEIKARVDKSWKRYKKGFVAYIEKGDVPAGGKGLARYLAKYVVSPPISIRRILSYDGEKVRYWYKEHKTGQRVEEEITALEFIGRMVQHILPKGFQRIRHYGLHATCKASKMREQLKEILEVVEQPDSQETYKIEGCGYRNRIKKSFGVDPLSCPKCQEEMEFEGIWHSDYGWIVNRFDEFFVNDIQLSKKEEENVWREESMVPVQMCFVWE